MRRADDLTLVTMRKPGDQLTWDNESFKTVPEYSGVPQCVLACPLLTQTPPSKHCIRPAVTSHRVFLPATDALAAIQATFHNRNLGQQSSAKLR